MVVFDFDPPQMGDNPDAATRYLYRLVEQLKYTLGQIDGSQESQEYRTVIARLSETTEDIKSLRNAVNAISERDIDYTDTVNKPRINDVELVGNLDADDLGIVAAEAGKGLSTNDYTNSEKAKVANAIPSNQKGAAGGVCPLDSTSKIDRAYLPTPLTEALTFTITNLPSGGNDTQTIQTAGTPVAISGIAGDPDINIYSLEMGVDSVTIGYKNIGASSLSCTIEISVNII